MNPKNARPSGDDSAIWDPPLEIGLATGLVDAPDQIISGNQKEEPNEPQMKLPAQLKDLKVRVCHVNSPSSFYVRFAQYDSQFKRSAFKKQDGHYDYIIFLNEIFIQVGHSSKNYLYFSILILKMLILYYLVLLAVISILTSNLGYRLIRFSCFIV